MFKSKNYRAVVFDGDGFEPFAKGLKITVPILYYEKNNLL